MLVAGATLFVVYLIAAGYFVQSALMSRGQPSGIEPTGGPRLGDGKHLASYRFDLHDSLVPVAEIHPVKPRDFVHSLVLPKHLQPKDFKDESKPALMHLLFPADRVIGVEVGGRTRAYPLRILNWHEVVNDVVDGRPVAVVYHPLTDGAAVFDRRVGGRTLVFRASGLVYQSETLLYEQEEKVGTESLWSQLLAKAVAGPEAVKGARLTPIPFQLVTWKAWLSRHPHTTVVAPDPAYTEPYKRAPYLNYRGTGELRFPVSPYPPPGSKGTVEARPVRRSGGELMVVGWLVVILASGAVAAWFLRGKSKAASRVALLAALALDFALGLALLHSNPPGRRWSRVYVVRVDGSDHVLFLHDLEARAGKNGDGEVSVMGKRLVYTVFPGNQPSARILLRGKPATVYAAYWWAWYANHH